MSVWYQSTYVRAVGAAYAAKDYGYIVLDMVSDARLDVGVYKSMVLN